MTRRILQSIQLDKIACVDRPCQEHAIVTIMKRDDGVIQKIADRLVKELIVVPIPQSSGQDTDSIDYNQALEDVCECDAWCNAKEELRPFVHALKHSLISIYIDPNLRDNETRKVKIQEAVMQFLDSVQLKFADSIPMLDEQTAMKRARELRKIVVGANFLVKALVEKSMLVGKPDRPAKKIKKDWSSKARQAAALARRAGRGGYTGLEPKWALSAMTRHHQKQAARHTKSAGETKGHEQRYHNSMAQWHNNAATKQTAALNAGAAYAAFGKVEEKLVAPLSHDEIALLQKAWSDKAREAALAARRGHRKGKQAEADKPEVARSSLGMEYGWGHRMLADLHQRQADKHAKAAEGAPEGLKRSFHSAMAAYHSHVARGNRAEYEKAQRQKGNPFVKRSLPRVRLTFGKVEAKLAKGEQLSTSEIYLLQKAWSDKAREAAAEARRHRAKQKDHEEQAAKGAYGHGRAHHEQAADAHGKAADAYEAAAKQYGGSKFKTFAVGSLVTGGVGGVAGLGVRAVQQRLKMRRARQLGSKAFQLSDKAHSMSKSLPRVCLIDKAKFHVSMKTPKGGRKNVTVDAKDKQEAHSKATAGKAGHKVFRIHGKMGKSLPRVHLIDKQRFPGGVDKPRRIGLKRSQGPIRGKQSPRDAVYLTRLGTHLPTGHPKGGRRNEGRLAGESGTIRKPLLVHKREELKIKQTAIIKAILTKALEVAKRAEILGWDIVEDDFYKVIGNTAADYIHDFVHSTNPRFAGKSKQERIRMALGAFYGSR